MEPLVSVLVKAYNHERFLEEALESALAQDAEFSYEIVLAEDCSEDDTWRICDRYARKYPARIRLLPSTKNWGMTENTMRGIRASRGRYIAYLDGDDYWTRPNKLRDQVRMLLDNTDYGLVFTDIEAISAAGAVIEDAELDERRELYRDGKVFFPLLRANFINACTVMFDAEIVRPFALSSPGTYWFAFDHWFWLLISMRKLVGFLPERTARYRRHAGGISQSPSFQQDQRRRYFLLHHIVKEFDRHYSWPMTEGERDFMFRKTLSLILRPHGSLRMKAEIARLVPDYYPGCAETARLVGRKVFGKATG